MSGPCPSVSLFTSWAEDLLKMSVRSLLRKRVRSCCLNTEPFGLELSDTAKIINRGLTAFSPRLSPPDFLPQTLIEDRGCHLLLLSCMSLRTVTSLFKYEHE